MAFENQDTNPAIKIAFDGMNTHVSELFIKNFSSPGLLNCDLDPVTTIRKRDGVIVINTPDGTGKVDMLALLHRMSEERGIIYVQRDEVMSAVSAQSPSGVMTRINVPWDNPTMPGTTSAAFTYETDVDPANPSTSVFTSAGECLYCTDRDHEPIILLGTIGATLSPKSADSIEVSVSPFDVIITDTGEAPDNFSVFVFGDMSAYVGEYDAFSNRSFYVQKIDADTFYLLDGGFNRLTGGSGWATEVDIVYNISSDQFIRWPRGVYSSTSPVRGYSPFWADPNGEWNGIGIPPGPFDWPRHTHYIGQGLGARLYAYGFRLDPDRIDYSELGAPYNFLRADPFGDIESESPLAPDTDGGYFYCMKGDGDRVVAVRELMGYTVVFKTMRTVLWTGEHGNWFRVAQEYPVGATNDEAVVKVGNDIYFWSFDGPRRLTPTMANADLLEGSISADVIEVAKTISIPLDARIIARHERLKQRVVWHFPADSNSENSKCLVYYYPTSSDPTGRWALWDGAYAEISQTLVFENPQDGTTDIYGGSNAESGDIYLMNGGADDNGENITMTYVTKWFDFDTVTTFKRALTLMALFGDDGPGNVKFYIAWDYSTEWHEISRPITAEATAGATLWNVSVWNDAAGSGDTYWNESSRSMVTYETEGVGRIFRFKIEDSSEFPCAVTGLVFGPSRKGTR